MAAHPKREGNAGSAPVVTYLLPAGSGMLRVVVAGVMVLAGLVSLVYAFGSRATLAPQQVVWFAFMGVFFVPIGVATMVLRLKYPASTVRFSPDGVIPAGRDGDGPAVPWNAITGGRRSMVRGATLLTDVGGEVVLAIDDRLTGVEQCLARIADAASIERPAPPARFAMRGLPPTWLGGIVAAAVVGAIASFGVVLDGPGIVFAAVFVLVFAWFASLEVLELTYDDSGLTIRRITGSERFGWEDVRDAVFELRTSRNSRWIEPRLVTVRGTKRLVPNGAPALAIVADLRARLRARR